MQKNLIKLAAITFITLTLTACGIFSGRQDETKDWSATKLYAEAIEELKSGSYDRAIQLFERLESRYPFGVYAQQAQLEIAYAYYRQKDQPQALAAVERFIKLHPEHPNVDYVYYLRGLINFNDSNDILNFIVNQDPSERDPKATREAFDAFKQLTDKFPSSIYTPDALARMKYLVNAIGQHEVHVAKYYYRRGAYLASLNRAQTAVKDYRDSVALKDALLIMSQSYDKLGMTDLRDDTIRVLHKTFPNEDLLQVQKAKKRWYQIW
jgi:outer membrane protein assembly factor BamD